MSYFTNINHSIYYYQSNGYTYVESPWIVDEETSNITKPSDRTNFYVGSKTLVASGEQSFLQLIKDNRLEPGKYITTTPCFRDENEDDTHKKYFLKTELIVWDHSNSNFDFVNELEKVKNECLNFFLRYLPCHLERQTDGSFDIIDSTFKIELGSYGIRENDNVKWIYATGCAEPRLSYVVNKLKKPGYHSTVIPKYQIGEAGKIFEEYHEFVDALLSGNKIMALVELSDLYGSIEHYLKTVFPNITMNDLDIMNKTTQKAFINKRR